jgi:dolichol kinase
MVVLTFGDPCAYLVGTLIGKRPLPWNGNKTWVGTVAFFLVPSIILVPLLGPTMGLLLPLVGAVVESLALPRFVMLDDNVTVPIASGTFGALFLLLFPGL